VKPRALDLFCGAGGATKGLQRAGFRVVGVDIHPQPHYCGDEFVQMDALEADCGEFDLIWASPPCQAFTRLRHMHTAKPHPNLIPQTRQLLIASGRPYCIENVEEAPLGDSGNLILLCGTMFGLQTPDGRAELRRHRLFETSFPILLRPRCQHGFASVLGVYGDHPRDRCRKETVSVTGSGLDSNRNRHQLRKVLTVCGHTPVDNTRPRTTISVCGEGTYRGSRPPQTNVDRNRTRETFSVDEARVAMGIDWMPMRALTQAIPPAYSEFIAKAFLSGVTG
jgi:DNA (cytosine-5)-methyltransferase 1